MPGTMVHGGAGLNRCGEWGPLFGNYCTWHRNSLTKKFDFLSVALAGVGGGVSAGVGRAFGNVSGSLERAGVGLAGGMAGGIANAAMRSIVTGSDFGDNLMAALPDIIGSTIGSLGADLVAGAGDTRGGSSSRKTQSNRRRSLMEDDPVQRVYDVNPVDNPERFARFDPESGQPLKYIRHASLIRTEADGYKWIDTDASAGQLAGGMKSDYDLQINYGIHLEGPANTEFNLFEFEYSATEVDRFIQKVGDDKVYRYDGWSDSIAELGVSIRAGKMETRVASPQVVAMYAAKDAAENRSITAYNQAVFNAQPGRWFMNGLQQMRSNGGVGGYLGPLGMGAGMLTGWVVLETVDARLPNSRHRSSLGPEHTGPDIEYIPRDDQPKSLHLPGRAAESRKGDILVTGYPPDLDNKHWTPLPDPARPDIEYVPNEGPITSPVLTSQANRPWEPGANDLDYRGTGKGLSDALDEAFGRAGFPDSPSEYITKWGKDAIGKSHPVEWRMPGGAEVNIDRGHPLESGAPTAPHVGYQTAGKRSSGAIRGHILLDDVPYNR